MNKMAKLFGCWLGICLTTTRDRLVCALVMRKITMISPISMRIHDV